jgi:hypothetical protein
MKAPQLQLEPAEIARLAGSRRNDHLAIAFPRSALLANPKTRRGGSQMRRNRAFLTAGATAALCLGLAPAVAEGAQPTTHPLNVVAPD